MGTPAISIDLFSISDLDLRGTNPFLVVSTKINFKRQAVLVHACMTID